MPVGDKHWLLETYESTKKGERRSRKKKKQKEEEEAESRRRRKYEEYKQVEISTK